MKKIVALALTVIMAFALLGIAVADETSTHTLKIQDTDQNVVHTFAAYQVFVGDADGTGTKLANIKWGDGVDGGSITSVIKTVDDSSPLAPLKVAVGNLTGDAAAAAIAEALGNVTNFPSTNGTNGVNESAGALDEFAALVASKISTTSTTLNHSNKEYTGTVTGDGYYLVIDETTTALTATDNTGSDTKSKNILIPVLKDTTVQAKDTHLTPEKEIVAGTETVKEGTAAIGDTVTFQVTIPVPNTRKYVDHFIFVMNDKLPAGMTFTGLTSVKVGTATTLDDTDYTLTVVNSDDSAFSAPAAADAATTAGGQKIKVVFNKFKEKAEAGNWIGEDLVVTYTAVVNKDANLTPTGNENEVTFTYSNDPNHDYDGDEPNSNDPTGVTPESTTKTLLANIEISKVDGNKAALAGAEFEIESTSYNVTLVTGEKFEKAPYTLQAGETEASGTYYLLKDGTYTTTAPTTDNTSSYSSTSDTYKKITFSKAVTTPDASDKITVVSGEDGKIKLEGLKPGTYTIVETQAPDGYNLDSTPHTIVITATYDATTEKITMSATVDGVDTGWDGTTATASIEIENKSGVVLPSTGGIGTTIFYISGLVMVLGAAAILVARRKAEAE